MTASQILDELRPLGRESYKRVLMNNHGVKEPCFGVAISELKKIQKRIKKDYQLALALYDTGNYDAMYLAGLIADETRMTREDLQHWVTEAHGGALSGYTVPGVAAESAWGREMALQWIDSDEENQAAAGWATWSSLVSIKDDSDLDLIELKELMKRVEREIQRVPDIVRYQMNMFVIAVGSYVKSLAENAIQTGERIGPVTADLGNNSCRVPYAPDYIRKVEQRGTLGRKRKSARC